MIHRRAILAAAVLSGLTVSVHAQVNGYAQVTAIAGTTISIGVVNENFGSFDQFKDHLSQATITVQGSGWGSLAWDTLGQRLYIEQIYDHQGNTGQSGVPLLVVDAWEHAYYLQYQNRRADYIAAIWNILDWNDVATRFDRAQDLVLIT